MLTALPLALAAPISPQLNCAVWTIAKRLFPSGWDARDEAPTSLEALNAMVDTTGRMGVWNGASEATIFADPETNYAFRAWHDWTHWRYQLPFDPDGECAAAFVQVRHLVSRYGASADTKEMAALVLVEVMGQVEYQRKHGEFPTDQRAFAEANLARFRPLAETLVRQFSQPGASDARAIQLSRVWRGWCG